MAKSKKGWSYKKAALVGGLTGGAIGAVGNISKGSTHPAGSAIGAGILGVIIAVAVDYVVKNI